MLVIGYGIAAIIVIVLLVVFNMRTVSKRPKEVIEDEPIISVVEAAFPDTKSSEEVSESEVSANNNRGAIIPARSGKNDQSFRSGLRNLRMTPEQPTKEPDRRDDSAKMKDSDYRNAMRNLHKSNEDKDKD
ncbi:hypothetical protein FHS15_004131 [Paenibacillus castaneae]|uniref:hypothetical protein n=1 Tax=Paenibacillus castaneae TaxID=474957 RepID=UPI000C9C3F3F|nr:hypothetical protein [Paenibacillus castaneae]NIK78985.1 hypothetical protein [Paenibacillus castaneae]